MFIYFISNQLQLSLFCHRTEYVTRYVTQRRVVTQPYSDCCQGYHMMHTICCRKLCDYVSNQGQETDSKRTSHCSSLNVNVFLSASCNFCNGYCIAPNTCLETLWRHDTYLETLWRCHVHRSRDTLKSICMLWNRHIAEIFSERFITFPLKLFEGLHFFHKFWQSEAWCYMYPLWLEKAWSYHNLLCLQWRSEKKTYSWHLQFRIYLKLQTNTLINIFNVMALHVSYDKWIRKYRNGSFFPPA